MLTPPQAARRLQVSADKLRGWILAGELRAVNVAARRSGRPRWRIDPVDLEQFLAARSAQGPLPAGPRPRRRRDPAVIEFY
jgi:excisionase family DNA binding protein